MSNIFKYILVVAASALMAPATQAETIPINPQVTQNNVQETICIPGWTKTVRPPVSYTNRIKKERMTEMGLPYELMGDFQLDHKLSLSLGGAPSDPRNLVMQDESEAHLKDEVERCLPRAVCSGAVSLDQAQKAMWTDWRSAKRLCTVY
jgi:hypothetical protein